MGLEGRVCDSLGWALELDATDVGPLTRRRSLGQQQAAADQRLSAGGQDPTFDPLLIARLQDVARRRMTYAEWGGGEASGLIDEGRAERLVRPCKPLGADEGHRSSPECLLGTKNWLTARRSVTPGAK